MTLTESLISSFILVGLVTQTGKLFGDSMQALGKGRLRDGINAAIHRDLDLLYLLHLLLYVFCSSASFYRQLFLVFILQL